MTNTQLLQRQYISEWHDSFVKYIGAILGVIQDLVDMAIEHLATDAVVKEFLKKLSYCQIEQNKRLAEIRLNDLKIMK